MLGLFEVVLFAGFGEGAGEGLVGLAEFFGEGLELGGVGFQVLFDAAQTSFLIGKDMILKIKLNLFILSHFEAFNQLEDDGFRGCPRERFCGII